MLPNALRCSVVLLIVTGAMNGRAAPAASSPPPSGSSRTRVTVLGTAGGPPIRRDRSAPANLLMVDGHAYLIDAGEGVVRQLARVGIRADGLGAVFLTHLHLDHTEGLAALLATYGFEGGPPSLGIYGPPGTTALTRAAAAFADVPSRVQAGIGARPFRPLKRALRPRDLRVKGLRVVFQDGLIRVSAVENTHFTLGDAPAAAYGRTRSYSYRFETPDRVIVFTGDTGPCPALIRLADHADLLISEVADAERVIQLRGATHDRSPRGFAAHIRREHLSPEQVGELATAAHVRQVVLTHFVPSVDGERDTSRFTAGVRRRFAGPVVAAQDLASF